jgi:hypothetical protein
VTAVDIALIPRRLRRGISFRWRPLMAEDTVREKVGLFFPHVFIS